MSVNKCLEWNSEANNEFLVRQQEELGGDTLGLAPHSEDGALSCAASSDLHIQEFVHRECQLISLPYSLFFPVNQCFDLEIHTWGPKAHPSKGCNKSSLNWRWRQVILLFYSALLSPHLECCMQLCDPLAEEKTGICQSMSREGHRNYQRAKSCLPWRKAERAVVVWPGENQVLRKPYTSLSIQKGFFSGL